MSTVEKDWITRAGLRAVVVVQDRGHRCGYVAIDKPHKYHGAGYDDVSVDVHGGLTYGGGGGKYPVPSKDNLGLWWFGFDCAHAGDGLDFLGGLGGGIAGEFKELPFVEAECESMARQLQEAR